jgi:putative restriction endonuclease
VGLTLDYRIQVAHDYTARTEAGRQVYDLIDRRLQPRMGTKLPAERHLQWHQEQVFKGIALSA